MPKANKPESRKPETNPARAGNAKKLPGLQAQTTAPAKPQPEAARSKQAGKDIKPRVGGTAVPGARSTQPREIKATNPAEQQAESYNRMMRRRMQHLGTGPYGENQIAAAQEKRKKRIERKKQRVEERRQEAKRTLTPGFKPAVGRKTLYFVIGVVAVLVIIIVLAIIINHPF